MEHFAYPLPFNSELYEQGLIPYRTNKVLKDKVHWLFSHVKFEHRELYLEVSSMGSRGLLNDMARVAVGAVRYYLMYPQQFGRKMENIHLQLLVKMWRQTFRHCKYQEKKLDKYYATKMMLMAIDNGLLEELIRTVEEKDYIQHGDDMVKKRVGKGLREQNRASMKEGSSNFEYLCSLE